MISLVFYLFFDFGFGGEKKYEFGFDFGSFGLCGGGFSCFEGKKMLVKMK